MGTRFWRRFSGMADHDAHRDFNLRPGTGPSCARDERGGARSLAAAGGTNRRLRRKLRAVNGPINRGSLSVSAQSRSFGDRSASTTRTSTSRSCSSTSTWTPENAYPESVQRCRASRYLGASHKCRVWLERELGREAIAFGSTRKRALRVESRLSRWRRPRDHETDRDFPRVMNDSLRRSRREDRWNRSACGAHDALPRHAESKGLQHSERPHRRTTITCHATIARVPLEVIASEISESSRRRRAAGRTSISTNRGRFGAAPRQSRQTPAARSMRSPRPSRSRRGRAAHGLDCQSMRSMGKSFTTCVKYGQQRLALCQPNGGVVAFTTLARAGSTEKTRYRSNVDIVSERPN